MKWKITGTFFAMSLLLFGCGVTQPHSVPSEQALTNSTQMNAESNITSIDIASETSENTNETINPGASDSYSESAFISETVPVTNDLAENYDFTICFAGDISLDENAGTTKRLDASPNGIYDCIDPILISRMQSADLMCLNNEFTYSLQGTPLSGKTYTFRANPSRVSILKELGVDLVTLANNHVYDYGKDALLDTFSTLSDAEIPYFGAGHNLEEAKKPYYIEKNGKTIAFIGASRAEKNKLTPQATEDSPGILRCYDTSLVLEAIREADAIADYVIVFVHWGTEYSDILEDVQITDGHDFIDAGADAVIGAHSHCLQGFEFYKHVPIVYSLGNYWFNGRTLDSMLVELHFSGDSLNSKLEVSIIPALQKDFAVSYVSDAIDQRKLYDYLESVSVHVSIDQNGFLLEETKNN